MLPIGIEVECNIITIMEKSKSFAVWLQEEINNRNWAQADLARHSDISPPHIARILSGSRKIGAASCISIANAFHIPPETVFRKAGLLPPDSGVDLDISEWKYILARLPEREREELLDFARLKLERYKQEILRNRKLGPK